MDTNLGFKKMERTLSIIKPDATSRNITGKVISMIEENGLKIIAQKRIKLTPEKAGEFYAEHKGKPFYASLIEIMSAAPVVVQVLEAPDAIKKYRQVMGATNPDVAEVGTIRKSFALSIDKNSVHGSDSQASAEREINFFFNEIEIVG